jgi:hypothetical protein
MMRIILEFKKAIIMITLLIALLFTFRGVIIVANIQNNLSICQNKSLIVEKFKENFISNLDKFLRQPVNDLTSTIQGLAVTLLTAIIIAWAVAVCLEILDTIKYIKLHRKEIFKNASKH